MAKKQTGPTKKQLQDSLKMVEDILKETTNGFYISVKKSENEKKAHRLMVKVTNVNREFILHSVLQALDMDIEDLTRFVIISQISK